MIQLDLFWDITGTLAIVVMLLLAMVMFDPVKADTNE